MVKKPSSVMFVPTTLDSFFSLWLQFLRPYHGMTDRQISLAAQFLKVNYELSLAITDDKLREEVLMNEKTKKRIREGINISQAFFQVLMGDLRNHKFIVDGKLNPKYVPKVDATTEYTTLMLYFSIEKPKDLQNNQQSDHGEAEIQRDSA